MRDHHGFIDVSDPPLRDQLTSRMLLHGTQSTALPTFYRYPSPSHLSSTVSPPTIRPCLHVHVMCKFENADARPYVHTSIPPPGRQVDAFLPSTCNDDSAFISSIPVLISIRPTNRPTNARIE